MRLLFLTLIICVSSSAGAFAPSLQPGLRLPELPEYKPRAFYYWQVMTAHEHGRVVTTEDGAPLKIHLAVKVLAGEDEAIIVIRDAADYNNCERLTELRVTHHNSPSGHHIIINDRLRNADGQEFSLKWRYNPNQAKHHLYRFVIYLPESTHSHPLSFIAMPTENPLERSNPSQAQIATQHFSGTNPDCD